MTNENLTVDRSGMRLGRARSKAEHAGKALKLGAFVDEEAIPEPPRDVDHLSPMSRIDMLGNDVKANCVPVGGAHCIQSVSAILGMERRFSEGEVDEVYRAVNPDDPEMVFGTNMFEFMSWWKANGFHGVEIEGFVSVDATNWKKLQQAIWLMGGCLFGVALPLVAKRQRVWRMEIAHPPEETQAGTWGGHCAHGARRRFADNGRPIVTVTTWGGATDVMSSFADPYIEEAFCPLIKGWEPPDAPGFDRDRLLRAMRELSR